MSATLGIIALLAIAGASAFAGIRGLVRMVDLNYDTGDVLYLCLMPINTIAPFTAAMLIWLQR